MKIEAIFGFKFDIIKKMLTIHIDEDLWSKIDLMKKMVDLLPLEFEKGKVKFKIEILKKPSEVYPFFLVYERSPRWYTIICESEKFVKSLTKDDLDLLCLTGDDSPVIITGCAESVEEFLPQIEGVKFDKGCALSYVPINLNIEVIK